MKVVAVEETFDLKEIGKVAVIEKNESKCCTKIGKLTISFDFGDLKEALESLADLGLELAILKGFDVQELEKFGLKIPKVKNISEAFSAPEIVSLKSFLEKIKAKVKNFGAIGVFVGFVRDTTEGKRVLKLEYEAYDELLEQKIREVEEKIKSYPGVAEAKIYHKLGTLMPGEDIVYIAVAGRSKDIWEPLKKAVELMKTELPIWKKEVFENGERWVNA